MATLALHKAIEADDLDAFHAALSQNPDISAILDNEQGGDVSMNAALLACSNGNLTMIKALFDRDPQAFVPKAGEPSPLHPACANGHAETVAWLLSLRDKRNGNEPFLDVNWRFEGDMNRTPLHAAIRGCNPDVIVPMLIDNGADINAQDGKGASPFITACVFDLPLIANLLIDKRQDITLKDNAGSTGFVCACRTATEATVRALLAALPPISAEERALACLQSIEGGDLGVMRALHEAGFKFDVPVPAMQNATPAFLAAQEDDTEAMMLLHEFGADLTIETSTGVTAYDISGYKKNWGVRNYLRSIGADKQGSAGLMANCPEVEEHPELVAWMPGLQALIEEHGRAVVERKMLTTIQCMVIKREDAIAAGQIKNTRPIWRNKPKQ